MKVLLATDGMPCSKPAEDLVAGTLWPKGTTIHLLTVIGPLYADGDLPSEVRQTIWSQATRGADQHLRILSGRMAGPGRKIETATVDGRPASKIVEEAKRLAVDLVVMGSRGRGTFAASLLGSVAAEVVDLARCPVLVARSARLGRILLAYDGSSEADVAASLLETWPIFQGLHARVVSVAPIEGVRVPAGLGPLRHEDATESYARAIDAVRVRWAGMAHERALRLERAGVHAREDSPVGDAAEEIVRAAVASESDLIVMGSHGRTGLPRLVLGGVARNVLIHAPCSVLIARPASAAR